MPTRKASPAILQYMVQCRCTHVDGEYVSRTRSWGRLAPAYQVWSRSANGVLNDICDQTCKSDAYDEAQHCDMRFMKARSYQN